MDDKDLSALIEGETPTPEAPQAAPAPEGPARDAQGKFASGAPQAATPEPQASEAPAPSPQPPLTEKETVGFFKAMQAEREKRQDLERKLADYQARVSTGVQV